MTPQLFTNAMNHSCIIIQLKKFRLLLVTLKILGFVSRSYETYSPKSKSPSVSARNPMPFCWLMKPSGYVRLLSKTLIWETYLQYDLLSNEHEAKLALIKLTCSLEIQIMGDQVLNFPVNSKAWIGRLKTSYCLLYRWNYFQGQIWI